MRAPACTLLVLTVLLVISQHIESWCWNPVKYSCPYQGDYGCIYPEEFCDGKQDCEKGGDEDFMMCLKVRCSRGYFKCPGGYQCLDRKLFCNDKIECDYPGPENFRNGTAGLTDESFEWCKKVECLFYEKKCPGKNGWYCQPFTYNCAQN